VTPDPGTSGLRYNRQMMRQLTNVMVAAAMVMMAMSSGVVAQTGSDLVVTPAWVAERLNAPDVVILHVGPAAGYTTAHIPGARLAATTAFSVTGQREDGTPLNLQMPDAETLRKGLESLGISNNSHVVVYAAAPNTVATATRLMLTLQHAGLGARSHFMPADKPGTLSPWKVVPLIVDADVVDAQRNKAGVRVVDARTTAFYSGAQTGGNQTTPHKTGHIEGAASVPFNSTFDAQGRFKSAEELKTIFTEAGVKPGDTVIAYCHIGQQATATIFAARLAGYDVKLYDGSFEDWSRRPNAAVAIKK
jgi:thiosulfate/3-mercaptopyruvate sulfurtransferase